VALNALSRVCARARACARSKKYLIERLQGEKIVAREKGVTTTAWCAPARPPARSLSTGRAFAAATRARCAALDAPSLTHAPGRSVSAVSEANETPDFRRLPGGAKVDAAVKPTCRAIALPGKFERVSDIRPACVPACRGACDGALDAHAALTRATTGYALASDDAARLGKSCARTCAVECTKPGRAFDFAIPFRP
jgi:hypothetical protein